DYFISHHRDLPAAAAPVPAGNDGRRPEGVTVFERSNKREEGGYTWRAPGGIYGRAGPSAHGAVGAGEDTGLGAVHRIQSVSHRAPTAQPRPRGRGRGGGRG